MADELLHQRAQPGRPLEPASPDQLRVEGNDRDAGAPLARVKRLGLGGDVGAEVRGMLLGALEGIVGVVERFGSAVEPVAPQRQPRAGVAPRRAVQRIAGVAKLLRPDLLGGALVALKY